MKVVDMKMFLQFGETIIVANESNNTDFNYEVVFIIFITKMFRNF